MTENEEHQDDDRSASDGRETQSDTAREQSEQERRLRRELARVREQVKLVQSERDAVVANTQRDRDLAVAQAREDAKQRVLQSELKAYALRSGIVDLDGLRLADLSNLSLDEHGEVLGAEDVVASLKSSKPYLFATGAAEHQLPRRLHVAPAPAAARAVDARTLSREEWQAERARLINRKS